MPRLKLGTRKLLKASKARRRRAVERRGASGGHARVVSARFFKAIRKYQGSKAAREIAKR